MKKINLLVKVFLSCLSFVFSNLMIFPPIPKVDVSLIITIYKQDTPPCQQNRGPYLPEYKHKDDLVRAAILWNCFKEEPWMLNDSIQLTWVLFFWTSFQRPAQSPWWDGWDLLTRVSSDETAFVWDVFWSLLSSPSSWLIPTSTTD